MGSAFPAAPQGWGPAAARAESRAIRLHLKGCCSPHPLGDCSTFPLLSPYLRGTKGVKQLLQQRLPVP